jgi:PKD repeat protein
VAESKQRTRWALKGLLGQAILFVTLTLAAAGAWAGSVSLAWDAVTGSSVTGYTIHYGSAAGNYVSKIDAGNTTTYVVPNLAEGATYHFAVTARDSSGDESGLSNDVAATVAYAKPVAQFTASTTSGIAPLALNFINSSTGSITNNWWSFGDNTTSTVQSPSHTYSTPGVYTVSLTVGGPAGSSTQTRTSYITVSAANSGTTCPCTIWSPSSAPKVAADPDRGAVELGVKFRADRDGMVTGVRFYKSSTNTGTHVGSLWTSSGALLARATFSGESASGWQQVNFSKPVAIKANTVYVVSYHTNTGHYAGDNDYFANAGVDRGPLHALRNGASGGNGVYAYGSTPAFPRYSYQSSNYWVDVVFQ